MLDKTYTILEITDDSATSPIIGTIDEIVELFEDRLQFSSLPNFKFEIDTIDLLLETLKELHQRGVLPFEYELADDHELFDEYD